MSVDWLRLSAYPASGSFTSRVFDAGTAGGLARAGVDCTAASPAPTVALSVRTGNTPAPGRDLERLPAHRHIR